MTTDDWFYKSFIDSSHQVLAGTGVCSPGACLTFISSHLYIYFFSAFQEVQLDTQMSEGLGKMHAICDDLCFPSVVGSGCFVCLFVGVF